MSQVYRWHLASLSIVVALAAHAQVPASECKERIVAILAGLDRLPAHEETTLTVSEKRPAGSSQYDVESVKRMVAVRVPPDRLAVTLWRGDQIRLESVSIGHQTWDRWPDADWQLQPVPAPGSLDAFIEDTAARIAARSKAITPVITDPECLGSATYQGRDVLAFRYQWLLSRAELWVEAGSEMPMFERLVAESDDSRSRISVTREFRYDNALTVNAPERRQR